jgi:type II secretory pathway pseudopilin PulG
MTERRRTAGSGPVQPLRQQGHRSGVALALVAVLFTLIGPRLLAAHETIDAERANAILAAADAAATRAKSAASAPSQAEALFALGIVHRAVLHKKVPPCRK